VRIKIRVRQSLSIPFEEDIRFATSTSPELINVEVKKSRQVLLTGLMAGEAMLIVSTSSGRQVFVVEVTGLIDQGAPLILAAGARTPPEGMPFSGSYELSYAAAGDDGPAMLRHKISL